MKEVMRIDRHGVKVNHEYSVDEATQHVLNALTEHIQHVINHAVAAEREACAKVCEEVIRDLYIVDGDASEEVLRCAKTIRARGDT